jgi:hypothetical protein
LKHWRKTSGVRIGRVVSSFSILAVVAIACAGTFGDIESRLQAAKTPQEKVDVISNADSNDAEFVVYRDSAGVDRPKSIEAASDYIELRAMMESAPKPGDPAAALRKIKDPLLYRDEGTKESANWLSNAMERMRRLFSRRSEERAPQAGADLPNLGGLPIFFLYFVWFLLGAAVIAFVVYLLRFVQFGKLRTRKAKAILEEDEPERTLDEWLTLADAYEKEQKYREAVRALYLACLLKFDERNIARFVRAQTNWEHLARIESSPRRPAGVDFRTPTQAFDRVWYGHKVRGAEDVADFRGWYIQISQMLREAAA